MTERKDVLDILGCPTLWERFSSRVGGDASKETLFDFLFTVCDVMRYKKMQIPRCWGYKKDETLKIAGGNIGWVIDSIKRYTNPEILDFGNQIYTKLRTLQGEEKGKRNSRRKRMKCDNCNVDHPTACIKKVGDLNLCDQCVVMDRQKSVPECKEEKPYTYFDIIRTKSPANFNISLMVTFEIDRIAETFRGAMEIYGGWGSLEMLDRSPLEKIVVKGKVLFWDPYLMVAWELAEESPFRKFQVINGGTEEENDGKELLYDGKQMLDFPVDVFGIIKSAVLSSRK